MKSISFIFNKAPYGNNSGRELLDICLMCSAFDMPINAIFKEQGVLQLLKAQEPDVLSMKNHSKTFQALELYGVEKIMVCEKSLQTLKFNSSDLLDIATIENSSTINQVIAESDFVIML